jgi:hypothetical protein
MPEPAHWDEVETADSGWSRHAVLVAAGVGAAGLALSDSPQALVRAAGPDSDSAQEAVNVPSTIEVLTTVITTPDSPRSPAPEQSLVGNEAVHRALARQALNLQPNDRAFMKYNQPEPASGPGQGVPGFTTASGAIKQFEAAGFGFGAKGESPGTFYDFDTVTNKTPNPSFVNTRTPH